LALRLYFPPFHGVLELPNRSLGVLGSVLTWPGTSQLPSHALSRGLRKLACRIVWFVPTHEGKLNFYCPPAHPPALEPNLLTSTNLRFDGTCSWNLRDAKKLGHKCRSWKAGARKCFMRRDSRSPAAQAAVLRLTSAPWRVVPTSTGAYSALPACIALCSLCSDTVYTLILKSTVERGISFGYVYCICTASGRIYKSICKNFDWANSSYFCTFSHLQQQLP
jgi:hypothetical protein